MRRARRLIVLGILLAAVAFGGIAFYRYVQRHPEDVPWTALDLRQPIGAFTGRKLAGLADDPARCNALLDQAGIGYTALPPREAGPQCGYRDAVRLRRRGALPTDLGMACPIGAALVLWEREIVQPAARRHFSRPIVSIDHFGSYGCRRLYGRDEGGWSEHARANALDIAGFRLGDGTRVSVAGDWADDGAKGRFLREVRDGACTLFATVLSPDYNAAHRDHLHLDQARRGAWGGRACR